MILRTWGAGVLRPYMVVANGQGWVMLNLNTAIWGELAGTGATHNGFVELRVDELENEPVVVVVKRPVRLSLNPTLANRGRPLGGCAARTAGCGTQRPFGGGFISYRQAWRFP